MEVAGPLGTPLGLAQRKRASPRGEVGDLGSIPGLGRYPGERNGNPLQYSCLENSKHQRTLVGSHGVSRVGHNLATKLLLL